MDTLAPAQRRALKIKAHHLEPVVIVGDAGMTPAVLREIDVHLKSHELIKIRVAGNDRDARISMIGEISDGARRQPRATYRQNSGDVPPQAARNHCETRQETASPQAAGA